MQCFFDTVLALFAAYGILFLLWWLIALFRARHLSARFLVFCPTKEDRAYLNWLKFAGVFPPISQNEEESYGTGIDDNFRSGGDSHLS